jgi:hypothetical protein
LEQLNKKSPTVSLRLVTGPVEINLSGNDAKALLSDYKAILQGLDESADMLKDIYGKLGGAPLRVGSQQVIPPSALGQMSIPEMIKKSGVRKEVDRVFLVTYYLHHAMSLTVFNGKDVDDAIATARMKEPKNINDTLNHLVKTGKLRDAGKKDERKAFSITDTGETEAEAMLSASPKD